MTGTGTRPTTCYDTHMSRTVEAQVDEKGLIHPSEPLSVPAGSRVLVTVPDSGDVAETALLAEESLATDWQRAEEDEAWSHLSQA